MTEKKKKDKSLYDNLYDFRDDWIWSDIKDDDDIGYPKVISFFCKRLNNQPEISGKVMQIREEVFDKVFDTKTVVRMITNVMFTKKLTKLKSGKKKRLTPTKKFLDTPEYDHYSWVALIETVRYAVLNDEDTVLLSNKELKLLQ